jgi:putative ABC transport system permease protein
VVVIENSAINRDGAVQIAGVDYGQPSADGGMTSTVTGTVTLPAASVPPPAGRPMELPAMVLIPEEVAGQLPLDVRTTAMVTGGPDDPVTRAQEEELSEILNVMSGVTGLMVERGWTDELAVARYVLFGLGALLVLIATLTATGLALTDARPDFATLAAVGAAPRTRRRMAMASAAVVGGGGALLGVLVGMAPGIAVAYPLTSTDFGNGAQPVVDVPWLLLGGVAVLVPLLAVAVTGLAVRSRLPMITRVT